MPIFNAESPDLAQHGPLVEVTFGLVDSAVAALTNVGQEEPTPVKATALIDTGAHGTVVRAGLLSNLGLHPVGTSLVTTPTSQNVTCPLYAAKLGLPYGWINVTVIETPLKGQNLDALIGRDVLRHCLLVYQGRSSQFTLSF